MSDERNSNLGGETADQKQHFEAHCSIEEPADAHPSWPSGFRRSMHLGAWLNTMAIKEPITGPLAVNPKNTSAQSQESEKSIVYQECEVEACEAYQDSKTV